MKVLTEKQIKRHAIECQDACNIIAVSILLADSTRSLSRLGFDSRGINSHPAIILIMDKLQSLTGSLGSYPLDIRDHAWVACEGVS